MAAVPPGVLRPKGEISAVSGFTATAIATTVTKGAAENVLYFIA